MTILDREDRAGPAEALVAIAKLARHSTRMDPELPGSVFEPYDQLAWLEIGFFGFRCRKRDEPSSARDRYGPESAHPVIADTAFQLGGEPGARRITGTAVRDDDVEWIHDRAEVVVPSRAPHRWVTR